MPPSKRRVSPETSNRKVMTHDKHHHQALTLSEARWSDHRRKIGLSPLSQTHKSLNAPTYDDLKQELIICVKDRFKRKECVRFVPKPDPKRKKDDPIKCYCGEVPERHIKNIAGVAEFFQHGVDATANDLSTGKRTAEWSAKKDIIEMPTNAFGKIEFVHEGLGGRKPSKYLRVADTTSEDKVIDFMIEHWRMNQPTEASLVITVIGGAKNFKLDGKKKEVFNRGLINAAQTTHAWIITSGCNMGVMKAVGEAVAEGQSYNWDKLGMTHSLRCIGIAPWGYVERNTSLISNDGFGSWNASYKVNNTIRHGHPVSLNPNHTHFLLVDDGFRGRYGGVAGLRAKLERKLALPVNPADDGEHGLGIPVVLVVVEGGYDAIDDVSRSIEAKIPVVVCEGTGRAADILAYAYRNVVTTRRGERVMKDKHKMILDMKLCDAYGKTWAQKTNDEGKEADKYMKIVLRCCENAKLLTVFDMNKHEDLDLAILSALLKGQGATNLDQLHDQLRLALTWNRSDVAEEKIFTQDTSWPTGSLDDIMTDALIDNKVNFVRLLLQNGVVMKEYLTVSRLRKLYNSAGKSSHLRELLTQQTPFPTLKDVGKLLRKLMGKHDDEIYYNDEDNRGTLMREEALRENEMNFPKPFRELFIWAVLMNRQELARFLWERGDEAIPSALAASRIYGSLSDLVAHYDSDLRDLYNTHNGQFEKLAVKVLEECQRTDPEKAAMLIERKYPTWGNINCLELAAAATDKEFLSTVACQNSLNLMWKRGIASQSIAVFLALIFPPLIILRVRFDTLGDTEERLSWWQKLITFYRAPVTKFAANVLMYLVFLVYYSWVILFEFRMTMTINEIIVMCWIFTVLIEEVRQMFFSSKADSIKLRLIDWWNFSAFNRIDLFILILAAIGFSFRFNPELFIHAKAIYCVNAVLCFIRLLRDYSASSFLGPKLVMITTMMKELLLYIVILVVFLLAYGVSTQALMHPIREPYLMIIRDIFYYPYWQIYGELWLEELEGRTEACRNSTVDEYGFPTSLDDDGNPCPYAHWLVPVLTAAYLLVGNLLLLNILIAIFNHVFNEIQTNSIQIWKYGMYFLVVEYDNKPSLAPPFIILEHIAIFFKWLICKACCKKHVREEALADKLVLTLKIFEKEMTKSFLRKQQQQEKNNLEHNVNKIMNRVDEMAKQIEEDRLMEQQHLEAEQNKLETGQLDVSTMSMHHPGYEKSPRRSRVESGRMSFNLMSTHSPRKHETPFSRWPSLAQIQQLKRKIDLEKIQEGKSSKMSAGSPGLDSRYTSDRETPMLGSQSESELGNLVSETPDNLIDDEAYDKLNFGGGRAPFRPNPNYDHIVPEQKIQNTPTSGSHPITRDTEPLVERRPKHKRKKHRKKYPAIDEQEERNSGTKPYGAQPIKSQQSWSNDAFRDSEDSEAAPEEYTDMKAQMKRLEHRTDSSLYNIESLLRNAVFTGGNQPAQARPTNVPPVAVTNARSTSKTRKKPYGYQPPSDDEYDA